MSSLKQYLTGLSLGFFCILSYHDNISVCIKISNVIQISIQSPHYYADYCLHCGNSLQHSNFSHYRCCLHVCSRALRCIMIACGAPGGEWSGKFSPDIAKIAFFSLDGPQTGGINFGRIALSPYLRPRPNRSDSILDIEKLFAAAAARRPTVNMQCSTRRALSLLMLKLWQKLTSFSRPKHHSLQNLRSHTRRKSSLKSSTGKEWS